MLKQLWCWMWTRHGWRYYSDQQIPDAENKTLSEYLDEMLLFKRFKLYKCNLCGYRGKEPRL